jgi:hypothetical protein
VFVSVKYTAISRPETTAFSFAIPTRVQEIPSLAVDVKRLVAKDILGKRLKVKGERFFNNNILKFVNYN